MKARFQSLLYTALVVTTGFLSSTLTSCEPEKCKTIVCAHGGTCDDGNCVCPTGYEGPQCETVNRNRFMGIWIVTENGTISNAAQYAVSVEEGNNVDQVRIKTFYNTLTTAVDAYVKGDTIRIPQQEINSYKLEGIGTIADDKYYGDHGKIILNYSITDGNGNKDNFGLGEGESSIWVH